MQFPSSINTSLLKLYARVYDCNLDEMTEPLESYHSIQEFFSRRIKESARPFVENGIASPVDGRIMSIQQIPRDGDLLEQIKGIEYSLAGFLGSSIPPAEIEKDEPVPNKLYHCIIYLAPGDYHGIHSPVEWSIHVRNHKNNIIFFFFKKIIYLFIFNRNVSISLDIYFLLHHL